MKNLRQVEITIRYTPAERTIGEKNRENKVFLGCFHGWEDYRTEDFSCKYAIVELEDGQVSKFDPEQIRFTGKPCGAALFEDGLEIEENQ